MASTLPVTGRSKTDDHHIPEYRANVPEFYGTIVANHHADISVRRYHAQAMGQQAKPRHVSAAIQ